MLPLILVMLGYPVIREVPFFCQDMFPCVYHSAIPLLLPKNHNDVRVTQTRWPRKLILRVDSEVRKLGLRTPEAFFCQVSLLSSCQPTTPRYRPVPTHGDLILRS
jgi:hypothetical protein